MNSSDVLRRGPGPAFPAGYTAIAPAAGLGAGMDFGIRCQAAGETCREVTPVETAWVLLRGAAEITCNGQRSAVARAGLFEEPPTTLHVAAGAEVELRATAANTEWAIVRTANPRSFAARLFAPGDLQPEYRGAGLVQNAALRNVRLIFDLATRPEANLVLGEVVNLPGRWSSYPPHHHDQPEIYHYRFTAPAGYGHAELGDDVVKVRHGDTVAIPPGLDHAQVAAPGYGMYYLWMIRHLPDNPYTGFTFTAAHEWTLDPRQQGWRPDNFPPGLT